MNEVTAAIAVLDFLLSQAEHWADRIRKAKAEGAILTPEQEALLARVASERQAVGLPPRP